MDGIDVSGLPVALAFRYDDDEPRSPWTWLLYLDERATPEQQAALAEVYTGRLGGDAATHFPWAWKPSTLVAVRPVQFEVSHARRRQLLRIRDEVTVRIRDRHAEEAAVTCAIPGHDQPGEELVTAELALRHEALAFEHAETCGYASRFEYAG